MSELCEINLEPVPMPEPVIDWQAENELLRAENLQLKKELELFQTLAIPLKHALDREWIL